MPKSTENVSSTTPSTSTSSINSHGQPRLAVDGVEDWSSPNEFTNVVLKVGEQKIYYIYEILALNSEFFYGFWEEFKKNEEKENGCFEITLDDSTEFDILAVVLKNLEIRDRLWLTEENLESVMYLAKQLKLELVLKHCESHLVKFHANPVQMITIANQYDMNELQHLVLSESGTFKKANMTAVKFVTSSAFKLPEMQTDHHFRHSFVIDRQKNANYTFKFTALIDWQIDWEFTLPRKLTFSLRPAFFKNCNYKTYKSLNWMVAIDFKLAILRTTSPPKESRMIYKPGKMSMASFTNLTFNTDAQKIDLSYDMWIKVRKIKGLRYYIKPTSLYNFQKRHPSSDVAIQTKTGKIFANLNILAFHSLYFQGTKDHLSTVPIDEATSLPLVKIDDVDKDEFLDLLKIVYHSHSDFSMPDFVKISPLIDRFLFCGLVKACEQSQIDGNFPLGVRTLQMALDFKMERLQEKYLDQFDCASKIHALSKDIAYKELSDQAKLLLYDKLMSIPLTVEEDDA